LLRRPRLRGHPCLSIRRNKTVSVRAWNLGNEMHTTVSAIGRDMIVPSTTHPVIILSSDPTACIKAISVMLSCVVMTRAFTADKSMEHGVAAISRYDFHKEKKPTPC
jgi:hypothetical protein